jgi:hypothetical protein
VRPLTLLPLLLLPALALARVDTHQFGLLQRGLTQAQVEARLGPPGQIEPLPPLAVPRTLRRPGVEGSRRTRDSVSTVVEREVRLVTLPQRTLC